MKGGHRLVKVLAQAGVASRRRTEELIRAGRVQVNGTVVLDPAHPVRPGVDSLRVDHRVVTPLASKVTFLLNKPTGYVSTVSDPWGRPTVLDLLGRHGHRLFPVGRLDLDTEGLILLTNDGELAQLLTHPSYEVEKAYEATVAGRPSERALQELQRGVLLTDGRTAPAVVRILRSGGPCSLLEIRLHEGRKRQIKRMCGAVGHPVLYLKRVRLSFLTLAGLKPGEHRLLTAVEVERLKGEARRGRQASRRSES